MYIRHPLPVMQQSDSKTDRLVDAQTGRDGSVSRSHFVLRIADTELAGTIKRTERQDIMYLTGLSSASGDVLGKQRLSQAELQRS